MKLNFILLTFIIICSLGTYHCFAEAQEVKNDLKLTYNDFGAQMTTSSIQIFVDPKSGRVVSDTRTVQATITAYTASVDETDSNPRIMASGKEVYVGAVACPSMLKFGTKIEFGGKIFICEDRMNIRYRKSWNFDIYFEDKAEARRFGRQNKEVIIKI